MCALQNIRFIKFVQYLYKEQFTPFNALFTTRCNGYKSEVSVQLYAPLSLIGRISSWATRIAKLKHCITGAPLTFAGNVDDYLQNLHKDCLLDH